MGLPGKRRPVVQEQRQEWALSGSRIELSQAAAWDARTEHFYAVAAVQPGAAKGPQHRLLGWPASYTGSVEDAPLSLELQGAVHAVHPIFPGPSSACADDRASRQTVGEKAGEEQHNSSSAAERESAQGLPAPQKQKVRPHNQQSTVAVSRMACTVLTCRCPLDALQSQELLPVRMHQLNKPPDAQDLGPLRCDGISRCKGPACRGGPINL